MGAYLQPQIAGRRPTSHRREHAGDFRDAVLNSLLFAVSLWLIIGSWALNYPLGAPAQDARYQEVMVGLVVLAVACRGLTRPRGTLSDVLLAVGGAWLISAPFAMGYAHNSATTDARDNDVVMGIILLTIAILSATFNALRRRALR
ncbi:hypothetical protein LO772_01170 [Yinghuangia sp. ASG 101]|uniref:SPW repeat domain-containing protein n=1 Tax=Yinghuangia sp. ASG 101 TaxID=2896848 RepID=UPI001E3E1F39|nr:hypothetical protein [Yinghuangia sp. ASG 101]UGQ12254.1 hypothetical protein LO772_01170 [Yinghuangia sp. ASG 101]